VNLPEANLPRSPQSLDAAPHVHVGVYRDPDRFLVLSIDGSPAVLLSTADGKPTVTDVDDPKRAEAKETEHKKGALELAVNIGDIEVVRGQQADVTLGGDLAVKVGAKTVVRGEIKVKSGKINVQSKDFDIQKGTISFVGDDPGDPQVNVTAEWTAPDGTHVFADYVGPVKTGKLTLRSEPSRPKDEIVSLILFGTADGSQSTPYAQPSPNTGVEAGTAVGGLATAGLSKGLDQLTGMNVQAKIDTSDSSNPRPEIEVQIAKALSVIFTVVIVEPPPGTNPDRTYLTLDWRFAAQWSLESTVGDEGSTFADMVWQHRY
jgi:translocation and assembly module TamB